MLRMIGMRGAVAAAGLDASMHAGQLWMRGREPCSVGVWPRRQRQRQQ